SSSTSRTPRSRRSSARARARSSRSSTARSSHCRSRSPPASSLSRVALEIGIVGLPSSGKSTLFQALTGSRPTGEVGMAAIRDERLQQLADVVHAKKVTPATIRVTEVRGTGPELLGNLRQVDALLVVLDGFSGTRVPDDDLETLRLELLVADRDHVERRLERVEKQAKSGDAKLRAEVAELQKILAHADAG